VPGQAGLGIDLSYYVPAGQCARVQEGSVSRTVVPSFCDFSLLGRLGWSVGWLWNCQNWMVEGGSFSHVLRMGLPTLFFLRRFLSGHVSGRIGSLWGWNPPVSALESSQQGCLVAERMVLGVRIAWLVSWSGLILGLFLASEPSSKDSQSGDAVPFPGFVLASRCCARCLGL